MAVTIVQNPGEYNLANGINAITLDNIGPTQLKYVLQIRNIPGTTIFADVRQAPNAAGVALFDIQQILKNYVNPSAAGVENFNGWVDSERESFQYTIYYGSEDADGNVDIDGGVSGRKVFSGRKEWDDIPWGVQSDYRYNLTQNGGCTTVQRQADILTDYPIIQSASSLPGSVPSYITAFTNAQCYVKDLYATDDYSISLLQAANKVGTVTANGITAARVVAYNSSGSLLNDALIYNYTALGGGPDPAPGSNLTVNYPYWALTLPCGPADSEVAQELPLGTAYYYVTFHSIQLGGCALPITHSGVTETSSTVAYRFNIVEPPCNDFTPIQLSWQNSLGFRDYWTFTKRWDEQISANRNEYLKNTFDWNGSSVSISEGARGYTVFGQKLSQIYTVRTDWLNDEQSEFLKNLFVSADVRAKLPGRTTWDSISLLSSTYDIKTIRKDRMFQYELRFRVANNINSQRG